jgi:hypothetical protein
MYKCVICISFITFILLGDITAATTNDKDATVKFEKEKEVKNNNCLQLSKENKDILNNVDAKLNKTNLSDADCKDIKNDFNATNNMKNLVCSCVTLISDNKVKKLFEKYEKRCSNYSRTNITYFSNYVYLLSNYRNK